jgi:glucosylceramidase
LTFHRVRREDDVLEYFEIIPIRKYIIFHMTPLTNTTSRRDFLRTSACATATALLAAKSRAAVGSSERPRAWQTDTYSKHAAFEIGGWKSRNRENIPDLIVDMQRSYQPILGFGAALTESSCYLLSRMPNMQRERFLHQLYAPSAMNLSVTRCCIGSSDYATALYNYDDVAGDVALDHFSIARDKTYILPLLQQVRAIRPDLFLHASPWSPPGWMKVYGSMKGGWMDREYLSPYADYLLKFLQAYQAAGVPVQAICTQNEVETDQHGMMPACFWTPEMEAEFVRDHLGPKIRANPHLARTMLWLLDYNYILWKRVDWQLSDPQLAKYVDGVAFHGYEGQPEQMSELLNRHPGLPLYLTEWSSELKSSPLTDWALWGHNLSVILDNGVRNITLWNLLLDENGRPEIGPFDCVGVVTLISKTGELERNGQFWALYHYSAHIQRGARRVHTEAGDTNFSHIALRNPDGEMVLILTNQTFPRDVLVQSGDAILEVPLSANSVTTVCWRT